MNISIERATPQDAAELVRVQIAAFHNDALIYPGVEVGGPPGYDSVESTLRKITGDECYKIVHEGRIIGGMVVYQMGQGHCHLDLIYIDPDWHNRGVGTQAMRFLEQTYTATKWTLDTPDWAVRNRHFYEKIGYTQVGESREDDITLIAYEKQL